MLSAGQFGTAEHLLLGLIDAVEDEADELGLPIDPSYFLTLTDMLVHEKRPYEARAIRERLEDAVDRHGEVGGTAAHAEHHRRSSGPGSRFRHVTKSTGEQRCRWCGRRFAPTPGRGRPRHYCRQGCRQQAHMARKLAAAHGLGADDVIVDRAALDELQSALYCLQAAVEDVDRDLAGKPSATRGARGARVAARQRAAARRRRGSSRGRPRRSRRRPDDRMSGPCRFPSRDAIRGVRRPSGARPSRF